MGSTANEICEHVEKAWEIGQRSIELLKEELGGEADDLLAVEGGGVHLHKIRGVMHDTCATANLTATLMQEKRNTSGQLRYGYLTTTIEDGCYESVWCAEEKNWLCYATDA